MSTTDRRTEKRWVIRSISLPVQECLSHPWPEFLRLLHGAWRQSTDLANWASQTLARNDVVRVPGMKELPRYQAVDLYALAFGRAKEGRGRKDATKILPITVAQFGGFDGARIAAAGLLRRVARKYLDERGKIVWRRERRTPEFLYPYPFPINAQAWVASRGERGQPLVSLGLPGGRVTLRLRQGDDFRTPLEVFWGIERGDVSQQELSLTAQRSFGNAGRVVCWRRGAGNHQDAYRLMIRISYRAEVYAMPSGIAARAVTGNSPFLTVTAKDWAPWVIHGDEIRGHIEAHAAFRQRMAVDLKYERRWPKKKRRRINRRLARGCDKQNRRLKTFRQQIAHQLAAWASRRNVNPLIIITTDRTFARGNFPFALWIDDLQSECDDYGVTLIFSDASGEEVETNEDANSDVTVKGEAS